jgi:AraC-like DNA-binding protein
MRRAPVIPGTFSTLGLLPVARALPALGIEPERVFGRCGLPLDQLADPSARLPASLEFEAWDAVVEVSGDPLIGLRLADVVSQGALGAYEYLLRNSTSLRSALERAQRYLRLMDDNAVVSVLEGDETILRLDHGDGIPRPPPSLECIFAVVTRVVSQYFGPGTVGEVRFQHARRGELQEYARRFGCPVLFEHPHAELVFVPGSLDRHNTHADPRLGEVLEHQVQRMLADIPDEDPWSQRARLQLAQLLAAGDASLPRLAEAMHLSARTLRRRLLDHHTSYKQLLDDVRRDIAYYYVARTEESFDQIAGRLGFAEASAFYRAFKRWADTTPAAYRGKG